MLSLIQVRSSLNLELLQTYKLTILFNPNFTLSVVCC